jgi:hypothetical protein
VRDAYLILTGQYDDAVAAMSRYVGGVYIDRAFVGQEGGGRPFTPVPEKLQREAMKAMDRYLFSARAFAVEGDLYGYLQRQRRGFNFFDSREEPGIHGRVLEMQREVLDQLLHRRTLERISDSELYGNTYSLAEVLGDLTDVVCRGDGKAGPNSFRRQLQAKYVDRLIDISGVEGGSSYAENAKSLAFAELLELQRFFGSRPAPGATPRKVDAAVEAHLTYMTHRIKRAMEGD